MVNSSYKIGLFFTVINKICLLIESKKYLNVDQCKIEARIVGGTPVPLEQYPFAVQFFNEGAMCGGVILNSWCIITSAHCFDKNIDMNEMRIQIRSRYMYDFNAKRYKIRSFAVHENYSLDIPFQCDIAMVFVEKPIEFDEMTQKAILVNTDAWMNVKETNFVVTGWGWTKYGGDVSQLGLMMTSLKYIPRKTCSQLHNYTKLSEDMFCLYGAGVRDTCKGDSGGGVLWKGMIVGLTSHGDGCAKKDKPSVYTNLWVLRSWIRKQVYSFISNYCKEDHEHDDFVLSD